MAPQGEIQDASGQGAEDLGQHQSASDRRCPVASDASGGAHRGEAVDVAHLVLRDEAAGKSADRELDVRAPGGSQSDGSRSAGRRQSEALCKPDAVQSAAQSCAALVLPGAPVLPAFSPQAAVARQSFVPEPESLEPVAVEASLV